MESVTSLVMPCVVFQYTALNKTIGTAYYLEENTLCDKPDRSTGKPTGTIHECPKQNTDKPI